MNTPTWVRIQVAAALALGLALLLAMLAWLIHLRDPQTNLPKASIGFEGRDVRATVQVATKPEEIAKGLMFTQYMPHDEGMLLVFEGGDAERCIWMKNTPIPLSIAFIKSDGLIKDIVDASANSRAILCVHGVQRVLEMNAGWFRFQGLASGDKVSP